VKARIWKDRVTGRWCYDVDGRGAMDCPTWEEALSVVLAATSSHSAGYGLPLRVLPPWHPSPFVTTRQTISSDSGT
jgi:hypothetical protein